MKINRMKRLNIAFTRKLSKQYKMKIPKTPLPTKGFGEIMKEGKSKPKQQYRIDYNKPWTFA